MHQEFIQQSKFFGKDKPETIHKLFPHHKVQTSVGRRHNLN